jgi:polygalacturonase
VKVHYGPLVRAMSACGLLLSLGLNAPVLARCAQPANHVFNILDYGARNDGSESVTEAFQRTIEAAKSAGGGTILVPPGNYISGPIELFSNMTLDVEAGATIRFPVAPLPLVRGRYLGVEALVPKPLVGGHDVENVTVTGRGTLTTADYQAWGKAYGDQPIHGKSGNANGPLWQQVLDKLEAGRPISEQEYRAAAHVLRPSFICFRNAKNVIVQDIHIAGGPDFVVHLLYSENATVQNLVIDSYPGAHANGIVVDSSRFVRIADDYVDTGDDGIVIKAGKDADGLRVNRPSEHVTITNCTVHHAHGAVVIGSETSGSIRNVVASNITADGTENGIRIKSRRGRGGVVEDVRFDNWTMENVGTGIVVTSYYIMGGESPTTKEPVSIRTPVFRNIGISHITVGHATKSIINIEGLPEMPISGLHLVDVIGSGEHGLIASNTDGMELEDVELNPAHGSAFAIDSAANLVLDDISTSKPFADAPVVQLTGSPGAILEDSRAFPGTGTFLEESPVEKAQLHFSGNFLGDAKVAVQTDLQEK